MFPNYYVRPGITTKGGPKYEWRSEIRGPTAVIPLRHCVDDYPSFNDGCHSVLTTVRLILSQ